MDPRPVAAICPVGLWLAISPVPAPLTVTRHRCFVFDVLGSVDFSAVDCICPFLCPAIMEPALPSVPQRWNPLFSPGSAVCHAACDAVLSCNCFAPAFSGSSNPPSRRRFLDFTANNAVFEFPALPSRSFRPFRPTLQLCCAAAHLFFPRSRGKTTAALLSAGRRRRRRRFNVCFSLFLSLPVRGPSASSQVCFYGHRSSFNVLPTAASVNVLPAAASVNVLPVCAKLGPSSLDPRRPRFYVGLDPPCLRWTSAASSSRPRRLR